MDAKQPKKGPRQERYGWSLERILNGYVQHINRVVNDKPASLARPAADEINAPKQCFNFLNSMTGEEQLLRKALGELEPLTDQECNQYLDLLETLVTELKENPWEPSELQTNPPIHEELDTIMVVSISIGVSERTLRQWISQGMPHHSEGRRKIRYRIQLSVAKKWKSMKYRHKAKRHTKNRRL